ncbi:hypothetical protein CGMCC3_g16774 [Colletotrichum fructicola]|nr:uncharacterized protein CGMCC3_g16774 [Colletotrichum fructicola]KAE9567079.1 hypothetical protein CGMCC3_g16774 [Colletotrichum fructicola]
MRACRMGSLLLDMLSRHNLQIQPSVPSPNAIVQQGRDAMIARLVRHPFRRPVCD